MANLHLGLLAYYLANTLRQKLKQHDINHNRGEIVRISNTQKVITIIGDNMSGNEITVRKCSKPNEKLKYLNSILRLPPIPFTKRKSEKSVEQKSIQKKKTYRKHYTSRMSMRNVG